MSALFVSALGASAEAASGQHYPHGALYVVATPIGNLADISLRALHVLVLADTVACEDTRHTQSLLRAYGIDKSPGQLLALHQHNEAQASTVVIEQLLQGKRVAYVSDAGTPGISDPGARLAAAVQHQKLRTIPLPGASSITAVLSVAGAIEGQPGGFLFSGFLSSKASERVREVQLLSQETRAVVLLEAPHRMEALASALACMGMRAVTVGRELTKQFEEVATLAAQDLPHWFSQDANRLRGEFALVLHPLPAATEVVRDHHVLKLLLEQLPLKTAVRLAAEITGEPKNTLYQAALDLRPQKTD